MSSYNKMYRKLNNVIINSQRKANISERRLRGCLSKIGYDTEFEASTMAAKLSKTVYKCLYCPHYHLTSQGTKIAKGLHHKT